VPEDPYADPVTGVLRNKLGLSTTGELEAAEREITHAALIFLKDSPVLPNYDLRHLCAIHHRIFGDIYDWAGQLRTVAIAKGTWFCLPQYIEPAAAEIFRALHGESLLRGLPRDVFTERLTYYLGEINAIHPFREGNVRAQRAFLEQLASDAGFILDWQDLDADRNIAASAAIMRGDPTLMRKMLDAALDEQQPEQDVTGLKRHALGRQKFSVPSWSSGPKTPQDDRAARSCGAAGHGRSVHRSGGQASVDSLPR
jgi:cell filamentation protein